MNTFDKILEQYIDAFLEFIMRESIPKELEQLEKRNKDTYIWNF